MATLYFFFQPTVSNRAYLGTARHLYCKTHPDRIHAFKQNFVKNVWTSWVDSEKQLQNAQKWLVVQTPTDVTSTDSTVQRASTTWPFDFSSPEESSLAANSMEHKLRRLEVTGIDQSWLLACAVSYVHLTLNG
jgi:hypothetical protein